MPKIPKSITIYDLALHETIKLDKFTEVIRVNGGWIYKFFANDEHNLPTIMINAVFVPTSLFAGGR